MAKREFSGCEILAGQAPQDMPVTVKGWVRTRRDSKAGISFVHGRIVLSPGAGRRAQHLPNNPDEVLNGRLKSMRTKSAVAPPQERKFLGFREGWHREVSPYPDQSAIKADDVAAGGAANRCFHTVCIKSLHAI